MKRAQISTEYLIIISFVTFVVISILGIAYIYTAEIKDSIKINQVEQFADKIISSSESIFFAGEPSRLEITAYLPAGVNQIQIINKDIIFNVSTNSGQNVISFTSKVNLEGTISPESGVKVFDLVAQNDKVILS